MDSVRDLSGRLSECEICAAWDHDGAILLHRCRCDGVRLILLNFFGLAKCSVLSIITKKSVNFYSFVINNKFNYWSRSFLFIVFFLVAVSQSTFLNQWIFRKTNSLFRPNGYLVPAGVSWGIKPCGKNYSHREVERASTGNFKQIISCSNWQKSTLTLVSGFKALRGIFFSI